MKSSGVRAYGLMALLTLAVPALWAWDKPFNYVPPKGYVPDAKTAVRVGWAVLIPVYGEKTIAREEPLTATLKGGVWTVVGHVDVPEGSFFVGGVAEVHVSKRTGAVLRMLHGK